MSTVLRDASARTRNERTFRFGGGDVHKGNSKTGQYNLASCRASLLRDLSTYSPEKSCDWHVSDLAPELAADHLEIRAQLGLPRHPLCPPPTPMEPAFVRFELFNSIPHCSGDRFRRAYMWPVLNGTRKYVHR